MDRNIRGQRPAGVGNRVVAESSLRPRSETVWRCFHEIGHHVHRTVRPEYREKEDVADVWKVRLQRNYYRRRFRWIGVLAPVLRLLFGTYPERQMLKRGRISRAEYLESVGKNGTERL